MEKGREGSGSNACRDEKEKVEGGGGRREKRGEKSKG